MAMSLNDIRESGLLELYVLGELSTHDRAEVEAAILKYPELKQEIKEIENAFFQYSNFIKEKAPSKVLDNLLNQTSDSEDKSMPKSNNNFLSWILGGLLLISSYFIFNLYNESTDLSETLEKERIECEEEKENSEYNKKLLEFLSNPNNELIQVSPTERFANTQLLLFSNPDQKKNILQVQNLPTLANNQSFQLWSLKGNQAPIPMDVFEDSDNKFIELGFEENTNTYAITIEQSGGAQSPNLDMLIGVFNLEG